jgi:hypothetical protein
MATATGRFDRSLPMVDLSHSLFTAHFRLTAAMELNGMLTAPGIWPARCPELLRKVGIDAQEQKRAERDHRT